MKPKTLAIILMVIGFVSGIIFYSSGVHYDTTCFLKGGMISNVVQLIGVLMFSLS